MRWFQDRLLREKLILILMITSGAAIVLAGIVFVGYEFLSSRRALVEKLETEAEIIAANSTAALTFADGRAARDTLSALRGSPAIIGAAIYDLRGRMFASYAPPAWKDSEPVRPHQLGLRFAWGEGQVNLTRDILLEGERLGTLVLVAELDELWSGLARDAGVILAVTLMSLLVAYVVAVRLQGVISGPVIHLARTARKIAHEKNYDVRAVKFTRDELGILTDAFNDMLARIQEREQDLQAARDELEERVRERTRALEQEVAERRRAEEELRASEMRYRMVARATNDAIWDWDLGTDRVTWNEGVYGLFGYRPGEVLETAGWWLERIHPEERDVVHRTVTEVIQGGGETWSGEYRFRRGDGAYAVVHDRGYVVHDAGGRAVRMIGTMADITGRKIAESAMLNAKDVAEAASRAKSEFLANMSHEIRTPLNGIIGMAELVLDTELSVEQREYMGLVKSSADSLLTVINDILDFSKIEAGRLEIEAVGFSLREALRDTLKPLELRALGKGIPLRGAVAGEVPDGLVGDVGRFRQILVNLVGNAIKFTERGEIEVRIAMEARDGEAVTLRVAVRDTGIGIPAGKQREIFEAFTQADGSTTRKYGGTGLGLSISSQLVTRLGGRIWVESEPSRGSAFNFTVRFGIQAAPPAAVGLHATLIGLRVLVVDDELTNRRLLEEVLKSWKMRATSVVGAREAFRTLRRARRAGNPFRLALLDAHLPDKDGFQVAEEIRNDRDLRGTVLMILSSAGRRGDATRCKELGVAAYLTKPIQPSDLFDAIMQVIGARALEGAAPLVTRHTLREGRTGRRILLVEDNPVNQAVAVRLLQKHGHEVTVAANGRDALDLLEKESFDVALMDLQMPGMGGFETTDAIRARERERGGHLPIVAMTAHAMKGDRERCLRAGMDDYLSKPFQPADLYAVVDRVLRAARIASPRPAPGRGARAADVPRPPGAAETGAREAFDAARALARVEGDRALFAEIAALFRTSAPERLRAVAEALARGDGEAAERAAHTLKGSIGNFEALAAQEAARRVEALAREGQIERAREAAAVLEREVGRLLAALDRYAEGHAA
jgi:PAS domain S-box-containing protein